MDHWINCLIIAPSKNCKHTHTHAYSQTCKIIGSAEIKSTETNFENCTVPCLMRYNSLMNHCSSQATRAFKSIASSCNMFSIAARTEKSSDTAKISDK